MNKEICLRKDNFAQHILFIEEGEFAAEVHLLLAPSYSIHLTMQCRAYEGEGSDLRVDSAHESQLYGIAGGGVSRLDIGKIVQGEA